MDKIVLIIFSVFSLCAQAGNTSASLPANSLNQIMVQIGEIMVEIFPLIYIRRELNSEENQKFERDLNQMVTLFRLTESPIKNKSGTYQVSYRFAMQHLINTKSAYDAGDIEQARSQLYALGAICSSCHVQDTRFRTQFKGASRKRFHDDFSYAEFKFVTRDYTEAIKFYDKFLWSKQAETEIDIIQPLQRLITIYTQIYGMPSEGAKQLEKYLDLKKHTVETKNHLQSWINGLKALAAKGAGKYQNLDFVTLKEQVTRYLGPLDELSAVFESTPEDVITRVWLRGLLYQYFGASPTPDEIPKLLYWLSICDRSIDFNFYFSLADLYLKDCIINYPKHPYARRCFDEYNAYVIYSYTGSSGTYIPPDIQRELDRLQGAIQ